MSRLLMSFQLACLLVWVAPHVAAAQTIAALDAARNRMVDEYVVGAGVKDPRVIQALRTTLRHEFVDVSERPRAYFDMALPIGNNQTISSPFIVAFMTQSLNPQPTDTVLEIGTGSGYQAAVLSPLVKAVYTIEIVEALGRRAERTLKRLKYTNVHVKTGDGYQGWPEHAPFDKIIVTCSPEKPPQPLIDQLRDGGLMVIPVGERYQQTLYLFRKKNGRLEAEALQPTLFVPMTGAAEATRRVKPDPAHPAVVNAGFEDPLGDDGYIRGWYYHRQVELASDPTAPEGKQVATFKNQDPGRAAHLLQGLAIDGRSVTEIDLGVWVRYHNVQVPPKSDIFSCAAITFYDELRRELGINWIGPFQGSAEWARLERRLRVPPQTREAILRVGLFGATGEISFDDVRVSSVKK
jgi:protein-L-isoaspartate(D-aspartate) O-methyltransferase